MIVESDAEIKRLRDAVEWACNLPFEFGDGSIAHDKEISFRNELRRRAALKSAREGEEEGK